MRRLGGLTLEVVWDAIYLPQELWPWPRLGIYLAFQSLGHPRRQGSVWPSRTNYKLLHAKACENLYSRNPMLSGPHRPQSADVFARCGSTPQP